MGDVKLQEFIEADTKRIKKQIEQWNSQIYESNFARNFKKIFVKCKEFYEDEIDEESRKLTRLNTSITKLSGEDIDFEILEPLQLMVKEAQKNVNELKDISKKLKELQDEISGEFELLLNQCEDKEKEISDYKEYAAILQKELAKI